MQNQNWKVLKEEVLGDCGLFKIKRSFRQNPRTGAVLDFLMVNGIDWVNVLPITEDGQVILVRQYRHGAEVFSIEIPGGCLNVGETDIYSCAKRELEEETGYTSDDIILLNSLHPNPAIMGVHCHCFLARNVKKVGEQKLDQGEDIEVIALPMSEFKDLILSGKISHALVVATYGLYSLYLETGRIS